MRVAPESECGRPIAREFTSSVQRGLTTGDRKQYRIAMMMAEVPCPYCDHRFVTVPEWQRHNLETHMVGRSRGSPSDSETADAAACVTRGSRRTAVVDLCGKPPEARERGGPAAFTLARVGSPVVAGMVRERAVRQAGRGPTAGWIAVPNVAEVPRDPPRVACMALSGLPL
jgi:hypothetical protein